MKNQELQPEVETVDTAQPQIAGTEVLPAIDSPRPEASLKQRIGAALIDALVATSAAWMASAVIDILYVPVWAGYMLTRDSLPFLNGQSIGKKVLNLQAVSESGKSLSGDWNSGLMRNVLMAIPFGGLVELIVMLINKDKPGGLRRLGDQWAKTKVSNVTAGK